MNFSKEGEPKSPVTAQGQPSTSVRPDLRINELHKTITMATIARVAGVSQGAISSLLNDRDYGIRVSDKTRERVFKACRELGYIPNDLRAVVRMYPEFGDTCLLVSSDMGDFVKDPFVSRVTSAAMEAISTTSLTLSRFDEKADYLSHPELLPQPINSGTASKFLCLGTPNSSLFEVLSKRQFPVVFLGREVTAPGVVSIVPDFAEASRMAVEYLFRLGHRRIVILSGPFGAVEHQIIELNRGVRLGYENIQVPLGAQNIIYGDLTFGSGFNSVDLLFDRTPSPTAIFCLNDAVALGVLARCMERGIKVPKDLSILGCSDDPSGRVIHPALTTIHLPAEEMAIAGIKNLDDRVKIDYNSETKRIVLPVQLIERDSCAKNES